MLDLIFEHHQVPPSVQASLEEYLRNPLAVSDSIRNQMREYLADHSQLFDDCLEAMETEFVLAKRTCHAV